MKARSLCLLTLAAVLALSSCAVYDTAADLVGLPESRKPMAMRAAPPEANLYDVEINDTTIDYLKHRRSAR